jgi:hypothetical protein
MHRLLVLASVAAFTVTCHAAPAPALSDSSATVCAPDKREWQPSQAQVAQLERALGAYFKKVQETEANLPARGVVYARQYTGITHKGRKLIYGRFYPESDPPPSFVKPGGCWFVSDGGNLYWDIYFDPKKGRVVSHRVNGVA